jgi:hypothetical protein
MTEPFTPRYWLHKALAHPFRICWVIGTICLWISITFLFLKTGTFDALTDQWSTAPLILLSYAAISGLGFYAGLFSVGWLVLKLARRVNGAPYKIGESVIVLSGPYSGKTSTIYEIAKGQGGQPVPRVDLGEEAKQRYQDLFEEYSLLRHSPRTQES